MSIGGRSSNASPKGATLSGPAHWTGDVRLEKWEEVMKRHESFGTVEAAFIAENKRMPREPCTAVQWQ